MNDFSVNDAAYVLQLTIGVVFAAAGISKAISARSFVKIVRDYAILPTSLTIPVAGLVVGAEVAVGFALLSGVVVWFAIPLAFLLVTSFAVAVSVNLLRDRKIACGCFGSSERISVGTLIRLMVLLCACIAVPVLGGRNPSVTTQTIFTDGRSAAYVLDTLLLSAFLVAVLAWLSRLTDLRVLVTLQPRRSDEARGGTHG